MTFSSTRISSSGRLFAGVLVFAFMLQQTAVATPRIARADTTPSAPVCTPHTLDVVSGTSDMVTETSAPAVLVSTLPSAWTAVVPNGAQWIWGTDPVADPSVDTTFHFTKTFTVSGTTSASSIILAADNNFSVSVNGHDIGSDNSGGSFTTSKTYTIDPTFLVDGSNTLSFSVTNTAWNTTDPLMNPAGLIYSLHADSESCAAPAKTDQTITFGSLSSKTVGDADFSVDATTTSGLPVTFAATGDCSIVSTSTSSAVIHIDQAGSCSIVASQAGDDTYNAASDVTQDFTINPAVVVPTAPTIAIIGANPINVTVGSTFTDPGATATSTVDNVAIASTSITVSGTVDTSTPGTTVLTYSVTDHGITSTTTRTVIVNPVAVVIPPSNGGGSGGSISSSGSYIGGSSSSGGGTASYATAPLASTPATASCPLISTFMSYGANNDSADVARLQSFLKNVEHLDVQVTGTFDRTTETAVKAFQAKYLSDTMGPWHVGAPSGLVYITTKKKVNQIACDYSLALTSDERSVIDSFIAHRQSGQTIGSAVTAPASASAPATTQDQGTTVTPSTDTSGSMQQNQGTDNTSAPANPMVGQTDASGADSTAAAGNSSFLGRFWNFIKGIF